MALTRITGTVIKDGGLQNADLPDSGVTANSYGSGTAIPVLTVNSKGIVTSVTTTSVAGVSSLSWDTGTEILTLSTADGGSYTADLSGMASQGYVDTAINNLIAAAPGTLNTLDELAAALGDDANFASTVTTSLAGKVDKINITGATVGSASQVPVITFNAQGQITSATSTAVAGVSALSYNQTTGVLTIDTADGGQFTTDINVGISDQPTFTNVFINDTTGYRGIARDNAGYNLNLMGGNGAQDGATITVNGGQRGGAGNALNASLEFYTGSDYAASQSAVVGDYYFKTQWLGNSKTLMSIDSSTGYVGINATPSATLTVGGNISVTGTVKGRDIAADGTKLDGIEVGATADQTKADIDALGINAATLDSLDSTQFLRSDQSDTMTGSLSITDRIYWQVSAADTAKVQADARDYGADAILHWHNIGDGGGSALSFKQAWFDGNYYINLIPDGTGTLNISRSTGDANITLTGNLAVGNSTLLDAGADGGTLQIGDNTTILNHNDGTYIKTNTYYDGTSKYVNNGYATSIDIAGGNTNFLVAPSGTAGTTASFNSALYIANTGNIGVGTTTPGSDLSVFGTAVLAHTDVSLTTSAQFGQLEIQKDDVDANWSYLSFHETGSIAWQQGILDNKFVIASTGGAAKTYTDTEHLTIDSSGNVGIKTTAPSYPLHVNGQAYISDDLLVQDSAEFERGANPIRIGDGFGSGGSATIHKYQQPLYLQYNNGNSVDELRIGGGGTSVSITDHQNASYRLNSGSGNSWTNADGGNFGVGTIAPASKLHVAGRSRLGSGYYQIFTGSRSGNAASFDMFDIVGPTQQGFTVVTIDFGHSGGGMHGAYRRFAIKTNNYTDLNILEDYQAEYGGGLGFEVTRPNNTTIRINWLGATSFADSYDLTVIVESNQQFSISNIGMSTLSST